MAEKTATIVLKAVDAASGVFRKVSSEFDAVSAKVSRAAASGGAFGGTGFDPFHLPVRSTAQRGAFEQDVRDELAERKRIAREEARKKDLSAAADAFDPLKIKSDRAEQEEIVRDAMVARAVSITRNTNRLRSAAAESGKATGAEFQKGLLGQIGDIGHVLKLLHGGGILAGFTIGANIVRNAAVAAEELSSQLDRGEITSEQFRDRLIAFIPVLGQIHEAGAAINEVFTGWYENQKLIAEEARRTSEFYQAQKKAIENAKSASEEHQRAMVSFRGDTAVAALTGPARDIAASLAAQEKADADAKARGEARKRQAAEESKAITDNLSAEIKKRLDIRATTKSLYADLVASREQATMKTQLQAEVQRRGTDEDKIAQETEDEKRAIFLRGGEERSRIVGQELIRMAGQYRETAGRIGGWITDLIGAAWKKAGEFAQTQFNAEGVLQQARISVLEAEGRAGNQLAEVEAKRLRIAEQYSQRRQELLALLDEEKITEEQRLRVQQQLADLPAQQKREQDLVKPTETRHDQRIAFEAIGQTTGAALLQRQESGYDRLGRKLDDHGRKFDRILTAAEALRRLAETDSVTQVTAIK